MRSRLNCKLIGKNIACNDQYQLNNFAISIQLQNHLYLSADNLYNTVIMRGSVFTITEALNKILKFIETVHQLKSAIEMTVARIGMYMVDLALQLQRFNFYLNVSSIVE